MENLGKKVGYLKGLMEGMDCDTSTANGKLMHGIVELLSDLCDRVENMDELLDDLNDYVESIDDDLSELESERDDDDDASEGFFGEDDDDDDDFDDAFGEGADQLHLLHPAEEEDDEEEALSGNLCPECNRMFFTSLYDPEDAKYICPHCEKQIKPVPLTPENAPIAHPVEKE